MLKKLSLLFMVLCSTHMTIAKGIQVRDAYARATVSGMKQSGAFVTLHNTDNQNNALIGVRISPKIAASAELHTHRNDNGVMLMRQVNEIALPAKQTVALKPGADHIMFFDVQGEWKVGNRIPMTLLFKDGSSQRIQAVVKALDAPMSHDHHQHDGHHQH